MSMYCMQCSALGAAPLTVACSCGSVRWRGTYELPSPGASVGVTINNRTDAVVKAERDPNGSIQVTVSEGGDRQSLALIDAIRKMIAEGRMHSGGLTRRI